MGVYLTTPDGKYYGFNWQGWRKMFELAVEHGWEPAGTEHPAWDHSWVDPKERNGSYFFNDGQYVTPMDAKNLAKALERALDDMDKNEKIAVNEEPTLHLPIKQQHNDLMSRESEKIEATKSSNQDHIDERYCSLSLARALDRAVNKILLYKKQNIKFSIRPEKWWEYDKIADYINNKYSSYIHQIIQTAVNTNNLNNITANKVNEVKANKANEIDSLLADCKDNNYIIDVSLFDGTSVDTNHLCTILANEINSFYANTRNFSFPDILVFHIKYNALEKKWRERLKGFVKFCNKDRGFYIHCF